MKRISDENRFLPWPNRGKDFETMNSLSPRFNQKTSKPNYGHSDATKPTPKISVSTQPNLNVSGHSVSKWLISELIAYEKFIWLYNNTEKNLSQQKWRMNIQKFEVEAEESNKKSQDHLKSMPQSLPTQKTENFEFSRNLWKSGIFQVIGDSSWVKCHFTLYWVTTVCQYSVSRWSPFLWFSNIEFRLFSKNFFESHFKSPSGICTYAYETYGHQSSPGTDTIVCGHSTMDYVSAELWLPQSWSMKDYSPEFVQSLPAPVSSNSIFVVR